MKKTVVIYESRYGSTKRYAQWISEELSCPLIRRKDFCSKDFSDYETIIYGGGLYAGSVVGIKLITQNTQLLSGKNLILFTCGIADPENPENISHIRTSLDKILPLEIFSQVKLFHLRGAIDYARLSPIYKAMMAMLRRMLLKKDTNNLSEEDMQILDTYGKSVDYIDKCTIQPLIQYVRSLAAHCSKS